MVTFPNAKINLGLDIISKRDDGYHNISSVFFPVIGFHDILEIIPSKKLQFNVSGLPVPGDNTNNLIVKAYELMRRHYKLEPVNIHLHKVIPMGAGLGGGSADAAFAIKMLDQIFDLNLSVEILQGLAAQIGSDCPFFINNTPVLAEGTGTEFSSIDISLTGLHLVVICPDIHVGTADAYSKVTPAKPKLSVREIVESNPLGQWKGTLKNDFEQSVFAIHPKVGEIKEALYTAGAVYASMSGSGSSVYGIFKEEPSDIPYDIAWSGKVG